MIDNLASIHAAAIELPLMKIEYMHNNLPDLKNTIENFDYVIIPSNIILDYAHNILAAAFHPQFATVGKASGSKLSGQIGRTVIYPENGSGGLALFDEKLSKLDLSNKSVLIIKGEDGNKELYTKLTNSGIQVTTIDLYRRVLLNMKPDYLKKMLLIQGLQGIIITSTDLVKWLFMQAIEAGCFDLLKSRLFITIHPNIKRQLVGFGASRVLVTPNSKRGDILELIKKINGYKKINSLF